MLIMRLLVLGLSLMVVLLLVLTMRGMLRIFGVVVAAVVVGYDVGGVVDWVRVC